MSRGSCSPRSAAGTARSSEPVERCDRIAAGAAARACNASEEGRASPCVASNVADRLARGKLQFDSLRHRWRRVRVYSTRHLVTTGWNRKSL